MFGLIENMSYFTCPKCGERSEIFSHGGAKVEADRLGIDFLGEIPLDIIIREQFPEYRDRIIAETDKRLEQYHGA